jgi:hypothetical protein
MRGAGEGHYPWGDAPKTTMTNGNIEHVAGIADGNIIKVSYKGGQTEIVIRPGVNCRCHRSGRPQRAEARDEDHVDRAQE